MMLALSKTTKRLFSTAQVMDYLSIQFNCITVGYRYIIFISFIHDLRSVTLQVILIGPRSTLCLPNFYIIIVVVVVTKM